MVKEFNVIHHYSILFYQNVTVLVFLRFAIYFLGIHVSVKINDRVLCTETAENPLELGLVTGHPGTASDDNQQYLVGGLEHVIFSIIYGIVLPID